MPSWPVSCRRRSKALSILSITAQAVKTKEVSTWQSPRGKYPVRDVIRDVLLTGSSPLPRSSRARSAVLCTSLTECARNAVPTTAVRSRSSSPRSQPNNDSEQQLLRKAEWETAQLFLFYGNPAASGRLALRIAGNSVILYLYSFALISIGGVHRAAFP